MSVQGSDAIFESFSTDFDAIRQEIAKQVVAQDDAVLGSLTALVCGGHALLEGVPGSGKTVLSLALAEATGLSMQRIQFTPDLMPADMIGTYVVMETPQGRRTFEFQQGPIFTNLVLADHINRGTPKTQSALLEAMEGETVSVAQETFRLPQPFFVLASQNPQESEGVFPLPEPELDRFLFKLTFQAPSASELEQILHRTTGVETPQLRAIVDSKRVQELRATVRKAGISAAAQRYAIDLVLASHPQGDRAPQEVRRFARCGASPRGAQAMILGAKVRALSQGRAEATAADVRAVAHAALRHRVLLNFEGQAEGVSADALVDKLLAAVAAPGA